MKAILYVSLTGTAKKVVNNYEGNVYEIMGDVKIPKSRFMQMFVFGYHVVAKKNLPIKPVEFNADNYTDITLVTPVWAGNISGFMRTFLENHKIDDKNITLVASCDGGPGKVMNEYKLLLDGNKIINEHIYVRGERSEKFN